MGGVQVTIHPSSEAGGGTPDAAASADPKGVVRFTDQRGREIAFRRLTLSRRLQVLSLLGTAADPEVVQYYAMMASSVLEIAGDPVPPPTSRLQLDALLDRLEDETLGEIAKRYADAFTVPARQGAALKNA